MMVTSNRETRLGGVGIQRRRVLQIAVAATCCAAVGGSVLARELPVPTVWRGTALGGEASLVIYHDDTRFAHELLAQALDEIERLEKIFSLYRADSALVDLNRNGRLEAPPMDLVVLLGRALLWSDRTGGAFDVTVQPFWQPTGREDAADLVDYRQIDVAPHLVRFARDGMAVTLNGIAQGYISDQVATLFRDAGMDSVLINLGELNALGEHPDGRPWKIGIAEPASTDGGMESLDISDRALATSSVETAVPGGGPVPHIVDPHKGRWARSLASASVVAKSACDADALSTALIAASDADRLLSGLEAPDVDRALLVDLTSGVRDIDLAG